MQRRAVALNEAIPSFASLWWTRYVVDQLQCLGILQTCEVLKVGMPTRVTYTELKEVSCETSEQTRAPIPLSSASACRIIAFPNADM